LSDKSNATIISTKLIPIVQRRGRNLFIVPLRIMKPSSLLLLADDVALGLLRLSYGFSNAALEAVLMRGSIVLFDDGVDRFLVLPLHCKMWRLVTSCLYSGSFMLLLCD
jgi:hypothetical protein